MGPVSSTARLSTNKTVLVKSFPSCVTAKSSSIFQFKTIPLSPNPSSLHVFLIRIKCMSCVIGVRVVGAYEELYLCSPSDNIVTIVYQCQVKLSGSWFVVKFDFMPDASRMASLL